MDDQRNHQSAVGAARNGARVRCAETVPYVGTQCVRPKGHEGFHRSDPSWRNAMKDADDAERLQ